MTTTASILWTVARVKDELPDVQIRCVDGSIATGRVLGRMLDYPKVEVRQGCITAMIEFSWESIADALTRGVPLRL